jgi:protein-L-isoaspartate(D-aspartate) O-methyltransferase
MTDLLSLQPGDTVLEIGTGLGYHAAILAELTSHVWTVEIVEEFAEAARVLLTQLTYINVDVRVGDGSRGWAEHGAFDKIIVAAAAEDVPLALLEQLKPTGCMVMPLGSGDRQQLTAVTKDASGAVLRREVMPVRFTHLETIM